MKTSIEWRQDRAALVAQARAILDKVDAEKRDLNEDERKQYTALMGEDSTGTKSGSIFNLSKVIEDREALETLERQNAEKLSETVKPAGKTDDQKKVMKRAEFDAWDDAKAKSAFTLAGGVVED